jgi:demethylmenaquinone methyltransferase/2-methoxy-6-polyprenyl-1,4-benzoquinol methylase
MTAQAPDDYARFAWAYDALTAPFLDSTRRSMLAALDSSRHSPVLDLCCGTGRLLAMLRAAGFGVAGVDLSPAMLSRARAVLPGVDLHQGDAADTPFPAGAFRAATIAFALHEKPEPVRLAILAEARRVLAPGAPLLVCDYAAPRGFSSRLGLGLARLPERAAGAEHYRLFRDYLGRGACEGLLVRHGERFERLEGFLFGGAGLYRVG